MQVARRFLGGFGLSYKFAYDYSKKGADPLGPDNPLVMFAGALVGTTVPGAVKVSAVTKLPLTNSFGWSHGSMGFGSMMKWAGYDGLIITGQSERPVFIDIDDDKIEICDAAPLWGKDTIETTDTLKSIHEAASVLCIGQAGENLVKLSLGMIDYTSTLGQGGLGAVMGSKKLKAVRIYGSKGIAAADKNSFSRAVRGLKKRFMDFKYRKMVTELGMMAGWKTLLKAYFCTEYMTPEEITDTYGIEAYKKAKRKTLACPGCMVGDKEIVCTSNEKHGEQIVPATSYAEIPSFATAFKIKDLSDAFYLYDKCNRYGISCQTLEGLLDFVIDMYEKKVIAREHFEGLEISRDYDSVNMLIDMITNREGIGDTLADGWQGVIQRFGQSCLAHAYINKGSNFIWDPRLSALGTLEFEQIISPKGPYSAFGGSPTTVPDLDVAAFRRHCDRVGASQQQVERIVDTPLGLNIGRLTSCFENWVTLLSSLGICNRASNDRYYSVALCAELFSTATGVDIGPDEIVVAAERAWTTARVINVREGFTRKDDVIPDRWFKPLKTADGKEHIMRDYYGKRVLTREDVSGFLDDYYDERGWDGKNGIPTAKKLFELGLDEFVIDMAMAREDNR